MKRAARTQSTDRLFDPVGRHPRRSTRPERSPLRDALSRRAAPALRAALLGLLGYAPFAAPADEAEGSGASRAAEARIVGGTEAEASAWPWTVSILAIGRAGDTRAQQFCGGSVIAPRWVLTAAHCVDESVAPEDIQVLVDTHRLGQGKGRRIDVHAIHRHEDFVDRSNENDIALLELSRPARVEAVGVPDPARSAELTAPGTPATVIGWGYLREVDLHCEVGSSERGDACWTDSGNEGHLVDTRTGQPVRLSDVLPAHLMEVEVPLVDERTCLDAYPGQAIDARMLCAGELEGGKDSCQGDSGGPLVLRDGDAWVQAGVVSWGHGCARPGKYGVYTKVAAFVPWIEARTGLALASGGAPSPAPEAPEEALLPDPDASATVQAAAPDPEADPDPEPGVQVASDASDAQPSPSAAAPPGGRALIVGIDRYAEDRFQDLQGAVRDAHNIRRLLVEHLGFAPEDIRMLLDEEATRERMLAEFRNWLVAGTRAGERALFYYAGHGYFQVDGDGDEEDGYDEVLVPHDARLVSGESRPMQVSSLVSDDEVSALLDELRDRRAIVIVDSCHSGTMTRSEAPAAGDQRYVRTLLSDDARDFGRRSLFEAGYTRSAAAARQRDTAGFVETRDNLVAWSAVSALQLALEDRESARPEGVFTRRFVAGIAEGLADRDGDGRVVYSELLDYVRAESAAYCRRHPRHCEAGLTPTLQARRDLLVADVKSGALLDGGAASVAGAAFGHSNAAGVQLEIRPSARLRIGDEVHYRVRSARSGHLLIVNVSPAGTVHQLFPNQFSGGAGRGAVIEAGRMVEIPNAYYGFSMEAGPPAGRGVLYAIVTEDPVSFDDLVDRYRDLRPVEGAREWLLALAERLREPWLEEKGTREAQWSGVIVEYEILP